MYAATSARVIALGGELTSRKFFGSSIQLAHRSEASSIVVVRTRKLPQSIVTRFCGAVGAGASAMGPSTGGALNVIFRQREQAKQLTVRVVIVGKTKPWKRVRSRAPSIMNATRLKMFPPVMHPLPDAGKSGDQARTPLIAS